MADSKFILSDTYLIVSFNSNVKLTNGCILIEIIWLKISNKKLTDEMTKQITFDTFIL